MKKLLLILMTLAFALPVALAGEKTVTISRNEGIYDDGTGVYYCSKGGITMTFSSGLNNVNYLVEHQQVVFDIFSTNYVIKKIKFNCLDNTTDDNLDCFYWGPSTISEFTGAPYTPTGTYTYSGYVGTWVGGSTPSKYVKFVTEAKPVRFGSVEITYDKEFGDIYDLVTQNSEIENGQTYVLVSRQSSKALGKEEYHGSDSYTTFSSTPVTLLNNNQKVKVTDEVQLIKLQASGDGNRPWYIKVGDNYMRRRNGNYTSGSGNTYGYNLYSQENIASGTEGNYRVSISVTGNTNNNALIRFTHNSSETAAPSGGVTRQFAIRHYNGGSLFRVMDYSSNNNEASYQRVYLYKPAQSFEVTTECNPTDGGYITLGGGVLTDNQGKNWSQHYDNVTFFVGAMDGYGIDQVTMTNLSTNEVTVLNPTSTSDFGNDYSFEMPAANVKVTATFVEPHVIHTVSNPTDGGGFNFLNGYTDFNGQTMSNEGKTVTFKPEPADDYIFTSVTYTDNVTGQTTTLTPDADGVYSFVMPGNDVTLTANFVAATELYLLGTANGKTGWEPKGPKFTYDADNEKYYIDVYFRGSNGYFSLTKKIDENGNWGNINGYRLGAQYNNFWVEDGSTAQLYPNHNDDAFKIPPGVYRIEVDKDMQSMHIIKYELTMTFDPASGSIVEPGQVVTATSNLDELVHAINPNEENALYYNTIDNWSHQENDNTAVINNEGYTTMIANANIGYIHVEDQATYRIIGDLYLLGTANGKSAWFPYGPKFSYDANAGEYYIDVYFKGYNDDPNAEDGYGYFSLSTRIGSNDTDWGSINGYRIFAASHDYFVEDNENPYQNCFQRNNDQAFKIPAGVYRITVDVDMNWMRISEYPTTLTFNPASGATVAAGDQVNITSNLDQLVHAINPDEENATFKYATSTDGTLPTPNTEGSTVTITAVDATTTVNAQANIGYITATGNANYIIPAPPVYSITTIVTPDGAGTITAPADAVVGSTVTFTVGTNEGYRLDQVQVTYGTNLAILDHTYNPETGEYTFVMPNDNVRIYADYEASYVITTLKDIEDPNNSIKQGDNVIVADELIGVWKVRQYLWAKDQAQSNYFLPKGENTIDFVRDRMKREGIDWQPRDWDQSNWVILDFGGINDFLRWEEDPAIYQAMQAQMDRFVDNKIKQGTISGKYNCKGLSTTDGQYDGDPYATKRNHLITLSKVPDCDTEPTGLIENSLGYPGYDEDPLETKHYPGHPERYMYNHYMPYNFLTANTVTEGISPSEASISHYNLNPNDRYFFMAPKDQEVAHVWAVWVGQKEFEDPMGPVTPGNDPIMMEQDVFATYRYSPADDVNKYGFSGAFYVENWDYNRLYDENGAELYGKPGVDNDPSYALQVDKAYMFHIAIQYPARVESVPQAPIARAPEASNDNPGAYKVYPLDMMGSNQTITAVRELQSQDAVTIKSMTYYNMMGQASDTPFDGINVIVVRYSDGSSKSWKVLK